LVGADKDDLIVPLGFALRDLGKNIETVADRRPTDVKHLPQIGGRPLWHKRSTMPKDCRAQKDTRRRQPLASGKDQALLTAAGAKTRTKLL